jgi:predicted nucleic acid-binding protein
MKIYLDNCALQRPFDDKSQVRIALEAEAVMGILKLVEQKELELFSSDVLAHEVARTPGVNRRESAKEVLNFASFRIKLNDAIEKAALIFVDAGIDPLDALHLASAEWGHVDYFCTCDDKFLIKAKSLKGLSIKVVSPIELITEL